MGKMCVLKPDCTYEIIEYKDSGDRYKKITQNIQGCFALCPVKEGCQYDGFISDDGISRELTPNWYAGEMMHRLRFMMDCYVIPETPLGNVVILRAPEKSLTEKDIKIIQTAHDYVIGEE